MYKKIMFVIRFILLGWWVIPISWATLFPIDIVFGATIDESIDDTKEFCEFIFYGE